MTRLLREIVRDLSIVIVTAAFVHYADPALEFNPALVLWAERAAWIAFPILMLLFMTVTVMTIRKDFSLRSPIHRDRELEEPKWKGVWISWGKSMRLLALLIILVASFPFALIPQGEVRIANSASVPAKIYVGWISWSIEPGRAINIPVVGNRTTFVVSLCGTTWSTDPMPPGGGLELFSSCQP